MTRGMLEMTEERVQDDPVGAALAAKNIPAFSFRRSEATEQS